MTLGFAAGRGLYFRIAEAETTQLRLRILSAAFRLDGSSPAAERSEQDDLPPDAALDRMDPENLITIGGERCRTYFADGCVWGGKAPAMVTLTLDSSALTSADLLSSPTHLATSTSSKVSPA